jgi:hypothetical protein
MGNGQSLDRLKRESGQGSLIDQMSRVGREELRVTSKCSGLSTWMNKGEIH